MRVYLFCTTALIYLFIYFAQLRWFIYLFIYFAQLRWFIYLFCTIVLVYLFILHNCVGLLIYFVQLCWFIYLLCTTALVYLFILHNCVGLLLYFAQLRCFIHLFCTTVLFLFTAVQLHKWHTSSTAGIECINKRLQRFNWHMLRTSSHSLLTHYLYFYNVTIRAVRCSGHNVRSTWFESQPYYQLFAGGGVLLSFLGSKYDRIIHWNWPRSLHAHYLWSPYQTI